MDGSRYELSTPGTNSGSCFRKVLGPKAQIQKCWQALIIRMKCWDKKTCLKNDFDCTKEKCNHGRVSFTAYPREKK